MFSASRAGHFESPWSARYLISAVSLTGRYATLYASNRVSVALLFLVYAHYHEHIGFRLPALALGSRLCGRRMGTHCRSQYRCHQSSSLRRPSNWCRPKMGEREHEPPLHQSQRHHDRQRSADPGGLVELLFVRAATNDNPSCRGPREVLHLSLNHQPSSSADS